jgi:hypothetical protein
MRSYNSTEAPDGGGKAMPASEDDVASIDDFLMSMMTDPGRTAIERREPRCRICRDEAVRVLVNTLLDWHASPPSWAVATGHVDTYAAILRELEPVNKGRDKKNRITYSSLWVHAKRHYELAGITDYWEASGVATTVERLY